MPKIEDIALLGVALTELPKHTLWCVGSMEDGPFARLVLPHPNGGYTGGYREAFADTPAEAIRAALAAGSGTGETSETSARCEASQSGGEAVTPERNPR